MCVTLRSPCDLHCDPHSYRTPLTHPNHYMPNHQPPTQQQPAASQVIAASDSTLTTFATRSIERNGRPHLLSSLTVSTGNKVSGVRLVSK